MKAVVDKYLTPEAAQLLDMLLEIDEVCYQMVVVSSRH